MTLPIKQIWWWERIEFWEIVGDIDKNDSNSDLEETIGDSDSDSHPQTNVQYRELQVLSIPHMQVQVL